jgi:hypothetical protein
MARKRRKSPPSRKKYDENNPVVSFRASKNDRDRFLVMREKRGMSHGDIYRAGLDIGENKIKGEEEIREQAYEEGWEKGIEEATELYAVPYQCSVCGKEIVVHTQDEKKAIKTYMREHGWGHGDCIDRRYS